VPARRLYSSHPSLATTRRGDRVVSLSVEILELRYFLSVSPINFGVVYLEQDDGIDAQGDTFEVTFNGGAAATELTRLEINTDQAITGLGVGDVFFDLAPNGLGAEEARAWELATATGDLVVTQHRVVDGGMLLELEFQQFQSGDKLTFIIDVDEVEDYAAEETDQTVINEGIDPITSGVEFQGSMIAATFAAPHYHPVTGSARFFNRYDERLAGTGLDLAPDNVGDKRDLTAAAIGQAQQIPLPVTIAGSVFEDRDGDSQRELHEPGIADVELALFRAQDEGSYEFTGHTTRTDLQGHYRFDAALDLLPGWYQIRESQPTGYFSVGAIVGTIDGRVSGVWQPEQPDILSELSLLEGGAAAIDYDFAEALPASLRGSVHFSTAEGDCFDSRFTHEPIVGATILLQDAAGKAVAETVSDADGKYAFTGLRPGKYTVREVTPQGLFEGGSQAGQVAGEMRGVVGPNGDITRVVLQSGDSGTDYDFCDLAPAELSGYVYHDRNDNGERTSGEEGIPGVTLALLDPQGQVVQTELTAADGSYHFTGLPAGTYRISQSQPKGWLDGRDSAGRVDGRPVGIATGDDAIAAVDLGWGSAGVDYNFGELLEVAVQGRVHLASPDGDCFGPLSEVAAPVAGATLYLLDAQRNVVGETVTDENGEYAFRHLRPGIYAVREATPPELFDGGARAGDVLGDTRGTVDESGDIIGIELRSGEQGRRYDFCELPPSRLSGYVYHDANNNGLRGASEAPIPKSLVILYDADGKELATAETDARGRYLFSGLRAGRYALHERQPAGFLDGLDTPGYVGGRPAGRAENPGDRIGDVDLLWGEEGIEFDFGELLPGSVRGFVRSSPEENCYQDQAAEPLANVMLELLNEQGDVVAQTRTDPSGEYRFGNLAPGRYAIREEQPVTVFQGSEQPGSGGGVASEPNLIAEIEIRSGQDLHDYAFCEIPPSQISGFVFRDGDLILLRPGEQLPEDLSTIRDGTMTRDDLPIAGVVLELRDGLSGLPVDPARLLPAAYPDGPPRSVTDETGAYRFDGLLRGNYAVYEIHPAGYQDGIDTPGTANGIPVNPQAPQQWTPEVKAFVAQLSVPPNNDAILRIGVEAGTHARFNNFSEVQTLVRPIPTPRLPPIAELPEPPRPMLPTAGPEIRPLIQSRSLPLTFSYSIPRFDVVNGEIQAHTWHLSVIDGGQPRSPAVATALVSTTHGSIGQGYDWHQQTLDNGTWVIPRTRQGESVEFYFGDQHAVPIAGDFNGDGTSEVGLFRDGEWFIDLNGNGQWDEGDLWAKLGHRGDLPVTGDWDGDGKDDIGIFGRAWPGDPKALAREPGLPDLDNRTRGEAKNVPPDPQDASLGRRSLKRTAHGNVRSDVIDHVLYYGTGGDHGVSGDWNGDGIDTIGIFRDGSWRLDVDGNGEASDIDQAFEFGQAGDMPIVGDFNGDGIDEVGVARDGQVILDSNRNRRFDAGDRIIPRGPDGSLPVVGDFDGDGIDEIVFYYPNSKHR
jgi:protocatechuate 3,4-dioxygenase beta subunit